MVVDYSLQSGNEIQFCTFKVGDKLYGINIDNVKEVNAEVTLQRIPHTSGEIGGYVNIRGQIFLIIDLRQLLGELPGEVDEDTRLILFKQQSADQLGILVDEVTEVVNCSENVVESAAGSSRPADEEPGQAAGSSIIASVCMWKDSIINIISIGRLRNHIEQIVSSSDGVGA